MKNKIIFCNCGGDRIGSKRLENIEKEIVKHHPELIKLSDFCGLIALNKDKVNEVFSIGSKFLIIGCHSRYMKILLEQLNIDANNNSFHFLNFLELSDPDILTEVAEFSAESDQTSSINELSSSTDWPSWYPVIDYSRCSNCGQCADFCLFGVYEKSANRIQVINPQSCKNNCPACARICPQTAIIFPKYKEGGAIGGSEYIDEISEQKRQAADINTLLDGDIYNALEQRKNKRKSIIATEAMKRALGERDDALNKIIK